MGGEDGSIELDGHETMTWIETETELCGLGRRPEQVHQNLHLALWVS